MYRQKARSDGEDLLMLGFLANRGCSQPSRQHGMAASARRDAGNEID
jgi:hypothetical protein